MPPTEPARRRDPSPASLARGALLVATLALLVLVPGLGSRDLWAPDEPRFAQVGREMVRSGDWVIPQMNGEPIAFKEGYEIWLATRLAEEPDPPAVHELFRARKGSRILVVMSNRPTSGEENEHP